MAESVVVKLVVLIYTDQRKQTYDEDKPNLFHGLEVWAESTVTTEDLLVNNGGNGQAAKRYINI